MNKSLKFLAIGLALAVLLVSQVGVDRSAVAHEGGGDVELVRLDQDEVMFVDHHGQEKEYYKFGDMVHFLLRDNDLAQDTSRFKETVTWALNGPVTARDSFNLVTGAIADNNPRNEARVGDQFPFDPVEDGVNIATTTAGTVTATIGASGAGVATVTFKGTDFPPADNADTPEDESDVPFGDNAFAGGFQLRTVDQRATDTVGGDTTTTTDDYILWERGADADGIARPKPAELTPLVEKPVVKIGYQIVYTATTVEDNEDNVVTVTRGSVVTQDEVFVVVHSADGGTFALLDLVTAVTTGCTTPAEVVVGETLTGQTTTVGVCTKIVQATFNYQIVDVFKANQNLGTGADDDENRALVTTSSSPSGKWVTIREVKQDADLDSDNDGMVTPVSAPQSNHYYGSITLVDDSGTNAAGTGGRDEGNVYARDGDTITVQFFEKDHSAEIGSSEATADGLKPSISGLEPAANAVLNEAAPVLRFTVDDGGSGFDTGDFDSHVDLYLVPNVDFGEADEVEAAKIADTGCKIYDSDLSATSLNEDEMTVQFRSRQDWGDDEAVRCDEGGNLSRFLAQTAVLRDNSHGDPFAIRIVAQDVAGNEVRSLTKLTIDGQAPLLVAAGSHTGRTWNVDKGKEEKATNAIRLKFNESLDKDTVDADDFTVENPDVSVEEVIVGGANTADGQDKDEVVYLVLSEDLDSSAEPRVEFDGSIKDLAGNERKKQIITRLTDRIGPTLTVDALSAQLLAAKGEATVSFGSDENLSAAGSSDDIDNCTCLSISGAGQKTDGSATTKGGTVTLPTPSEATYTFKQGSFKSTGLYGIMVQGTDSGANETATGATKVTDEKVTAAVEEGDAPAITSEMDEDGETTYSAVYTATVGLAKWPLADADFDGSLADEVSIKGAAMTTVTAVNWKDGKVTLDITYESDTSPTADDYRVVDETELEATYNYVKAEQTVQVDDRKPEATFAPKGNTQNATPFLQIQWDEDKEYKGDTHKTVTITSATLTGPDDFEMVLVDDETDVLSTSDWVLYTYLADSDLALGEYTITAIGRDEAGNVSEPQSGKFKVVARAPVTIPLNLGWNLVSLPGAAADSSIDAVINVDAVSQVLTYDPTVEGGWLAAVRVNGGWEGGLTEISASKAYLVYTTSVDDLKVDVPGFAQGTQDFPPTIQVYKGWNMIPASNLDPKFETALDTYLASIDWTRGYFYGADGRIVQVTIGQDDQEMVKTGRGFLIYVEKDGVLVP